MICTIYRSSLREQTYLYIEKKNDFSRVPADLLKSFGKPQLAMTLSLANREKLAFADINKVRVQLTENGYYLQVPPASENLLSGHLKTRHHSL